MLISSSLNCHKSSVHWSDRNSINQFKRDWSFYLSPRPVGVGDVCSFFNDAILNDVLKNTNIVEKINDVFLQQEQEYAKKMFVQF